MSVTLTTSNFTQFEKGFFITEAVIGLDTINKGLAYVATGIKNDTYTFPVLSVSPKLKAYTPTPANQTNSTVLSNRNVSLGKFQSYEEFDPSIFENHWHQDQLADKLLARSLPATFMNYLGAFYTSKVLVPVENGIHLGSTTYLTTSGGSAEPNVGANESLVHFDGLIKIALNATTPSLQVASPVALTSANIIAKMELAKAKMLTSTGGKAQMTAADRYSRLKFIMGVEDIQKYEEALTSTSFKNNDTTEKGINKYKGFEVVVCAGIPENTFYFTEATTDVRSNIQLAVTAMDNLSFNIDKLQANSELYFYKMVAKMGVGIAKPQEFVIYTTKVLADFSA